MLKPFDIEAIRSGAKCVTRNGRPARLVSEKGCVSGYPLMFLITIKKDSEKNISVNKKGEFVNGREGDDDIFLDVEPTYKPFTYDTAPLGRIVKMSSPSGRMKALIVWADDAGVSVVVDVDTIRISYSKLLSDYKFDNGETCGILES